MAPTRESLTVATRLPPRLARKLDRIAKALGSTRSDALRRLVEDYESPGAFLPGSALFAPTIPSAPGAPRLDFGKTRFDRVARRGRP